MAPSQYYLPNYQLNEELGFAIPELQLHRELHRSFDLNRTVISLTSSDSEEIPPFPTKCQNDILNKKDKKKRSITRWETSHEEEKVANDIDLELRLSPPNECNNNNNNNNNSSSAPNRSKSSSCASSNVNSEHEDFDSLASEEEEEEEEEEVMPISLVLMGCTHCYMYVMVSRIDPICPKCESSILIDMFRKISNNAERSRMS